MKTSAAAPSRTQATATSTLLIRIPARLVPRPGQQLVLDVRARGRRKNGSPSPAAHDRRDKNDRRDGNDDRNNPGGQVEAFCRRLGKNGWTIFLHESLQGEVIRFVAGDALIEFLEHTVRVGASYMVAGGQNLIAAADAHELLAEGPGTSGFLGARGRGDRAQGRGEEREEHQRI